METFRKATLLGLGAAAITLDKVRESLEDLVSRGDISVDEGKRVYSEFTARIEEEGRAANDKVKKMVLDSLKDLGVADKAQAAVLHDRIQELEARVDDLESKLSKSEHTSTGS
jgi:polyhydroxyalkanoate synthesis regulator phasin